MNQIVRMQGPPSAKWFATMARYQQIDFERRPKGEKTPALEQLMRWRRPLREERAL